MRIKFIQQIICVSVICPNADKLLNFVDLGDVLVQALDLSFDFLDLAVERNLL